MLKFYFSKGTCSLASMIVLEELELPYQPIAANFDPETEEGKKLYELNPLGVVPLLVLPNGEPLTEGVAILQYLADHKPEKGLAPPPQSFARVRMQETLNFIATEIHKSYSPIFGADMWVQNPEGREQLRSGATERLVEKYAIIEDRLAKHEYLMGPGFTIADAYLFNVTLWARFQKIDLSIYPRLTAYMDRIRSRPSVVRAFAAERASR
jgi:glutathione S-transferase